MYDIYFVRVHHFDNVRSVWFFQVEEKTLATLALFSYLGRESRLFLSRHNIKDTDEHIKDFIR